MPDIGAVDGPESPGATQEAVSPLLLPKAGGVRTHLENYLTALGGTPAPAFESASTDTLLGLVEAGHSVCLVPDVFVSDEVRERFPGVRFLRMASGPRPLEMGITRRPGVAGHADRHGEQRGTPRGAHPTAHPSDHVGQLVSVPGQAG